MIIFVKFYINVLLVYAVFTNSQASNAYFYPQYFDKIMLKYLKLITDFSVQNFII